MIFLQKAGDFSIFQPHPTVVCSNPGSGEVGKQCEQSGQVRCEYEDIHVLPTVNLLSGRTSATRIT